MLVFVPSNAYIVDLEYRQGMYSPISIVDDFAGLFLHPSTYKWYIRYWLNSNILVSSEGYIQHTFL